MYSIPKRFAHASMKHPQWSKDRLIWLIWSQSMVKTSGNTVNIIMTREALDRNEVNRRLSLRSRTQTSAWIKLVKIRSLSKEARQILPIKEQLKENKIKAWSYLLRWYGDRKSFEKNFFIYKSTKVKQLKLSLLTNLTHISIIRLFNCFTNLHTQ